MHVIVTANLKENIQDLPNQGSAWALGSTFNQGDPTSLLRGVWDDVVRGQAVPPCDDGL